jgi:hypothetical protein
MKNFNALSTAMVSGVLALGIVACSDKKLELVPGYDCTPVENGDRQDIATALDYETGILMAEHLAVPFEKIMLGQLIEVNCHNEADPYIPTPVKVSVATVIAPECVVYDFDPSDFKHVRVACPIS